MKEKMFKIIKDLETQGWELLQIDFHKGNWFATMTKDGHGFYIEMDTTDIASCCLPRVCSVCGNDESKDCDCNADYVIKKEIHAEYVNYKK